MDITIRRITLDDWQTIQKLNHEVILANADYDKHQNLGYAFSDVGIAYYKKVTSDKTYFGIIAEHDNKCVGYLIGGEKYLDYRKVKTAEIHNMGVSLHVRSKGIGARLIAEFKRWAKVHGYQTMYVNAYYQNKRAIDFYKKQGFSPIDVSLEMDV